MFKPKFKPIARGGWGELAIRGLGYIDCKIIFFTIYSFNPLRFQNKIPT